MPEEVALLSDYYRCPACKFVIYASQPALASGRCPECRMSPKWNRLEVYYVLELVRRKEKEDAKANVVVPPPPKIGKVVPPPPPVRVGGISIRLPPPPPPKLL